jgi:CheY-like chemotaxis protein
MIKKKDPNRNQQQAILTKSELVALLDSCERESAVPPHAERRKHTRGCRRMCDAILEIEHIGGGSSVINCGTRNISTRGISLITNVFVHPNSVLTVTLRRNDGEEEIISSHAAHCRHLEAKIHEVGVHFSRKINPLFFLLADDTNELYAQHSCEKPDGLNGWVIYISSSATDFELFEHYVRGTDVKCKSFEHTGVAIDEIKKGMYDVVVLDTDTSEQDVLDAASAIREAGFLGEILFFTADEDLEENTIGNPLINDILKKPFPPIALQSKLAACFERTAGLANDEELTSTMGSDDSMSPLLDSYIREVHQLAVSIDKSISEGDIEALKRSCLRIKGTGTSFGFEKLTKLSQEAYQQLKDAKSVESSAPQLRRLAVMCRKAAA